MGGEGRLGGEIVWRVCDNDSILVLLYNDIKYHDAGTSG